jgi:hypothetical protein
MRVEPVPRTVRRLLAFGSSSAVTRAPNGIPRYSPNYYFGLDFEVLR